MNAALTSGAIAALRRLQPPAGAAPVAASAPERCELCALPLAERHEHLLDLKTRRLACACTGCALLFETGGHIQQTWRRLPRDARYLASTELSGPEWASLGIPIELAFVSFNSTTGEWVAAYPSPAGVVTAEVDAEAWSALAAAHGELAALASDTEALLIDRMSQPRGCYIVPLDFGYRLAGLIRRAWSGFSGGPGVKAAVAGFTAELRHA